MGKRIWRDAAGARRVTLVWITRLRGILYVAVPLVGVTLLSFFSKRVYYIVCILRIPGIHSNIYSHTTVVFLYHRGKLTS